MPLHLNRRYISVLHITFHLLNFLNLAPAGTPSLYHPFLLAGYNKLQM